MAQFTTANATILMRDYIEPRVRATYQQEDNFLSLLMDNADQEKTNPRGRRIPFNILPNPSFGSPTEGAYMPQPGALTDVEGTIKYLNQFLTGEVSGDVRDLDDDNAIVSFISRNMRFDTVTFKHRLNFMAINGTGTGAFATVTAAATGAGGTATCNNALGSRHIPVNARMQFYSSAGAQRTGGGTTTSIVTANNTSTNVVTFDAVPTDVVATDVIVFESSYGRGLHGLPFHVTDDTTFTWLGLSRATYPNLKGVVYDAASAGLSPGLIDIVIAKTKVASGVNVPVNDFVLLTHSAQTYAYQQLGYALTRTVQASGNKKLDLGFPEVAHNGLRWKEDLAVSPTDMWGLRFSSWAVEYVKLPGFFNDGNGTLWAKPGSGIIADAFQYAIYARMDIVCKMPNQNFRLKNLAYNANVV